MYRYFYNASGEIVGYCTYSNICPISQIDGATNWIDLDQKLDVVLTKINPETKTLVTSQN